MVSCFSLSTMPSSASQGLMVIFTSWSMRTMKARPGSLSADGKHVELWVTVAYCAALTERRVQAAKELLKRRSVRRSLMDWGRYKGFEPAVHHQLICHEIDAFLESDDEVLPLFARQAHPKAHGSRFGSRRTTCPVLLEDVVASEVATTMMNVPSASGGAAPSHSAVVRGPSRNRSHWGCGRWCGCGSAAASRC